jgi:hypothetical protein
MPTVVTINDISGTTPYDIYICDNPQTQCIYIDRIDSAPYEFEVPTIMLNFSEFTLKIVDSSGCQVTTNLTL